MITRSEGKHPPSPTSDLSDGSMSVDKKFLAANHSISMESEKSSDGENADSSQTMGRGIFESTLCSPQQQSSRCLESEDVVDQNQNANTTHNQSDCWKHLLELDAFQENVRNVRIDSEFAMMVQEVLCREYRLLARRMRDVQHALRSLWRSTVLQSGESLIRHSVTNSTVVVATIVSFLLLSTAVFTSTWYGKRAPSKYPPEEALLHRNELVNVTDWKAFGSLHDEDMFEGSPLPVGSDVCAISAMALAPECSNLSGEDYDLDDVDTDWFLSSSYSHEDDKDTVDFESRLERLEMESLNIMQRLYNIESNIEELLSLKRSKSLTPYDAKHARDDADGHWHAASLNLGSAAAWCLHDAGNRKMWIEEKRRQSFIDHSKEDDARSDPMRGGGNEDSLSPEGSERLESDESDDYVEAESTNDGHVSNDDDCSINGVSAGIGMESGKALHDEKKDAGSFESIEGQGLIELENIMDALDFELAVMADALDEEMCAVATNMDALSHRLATLEERIV